MKLTVLLTLIIAMLLPVQSALAETELFPYMSANTDEMTEQFDLTEAGDIAIGGDPGDGRQFIGSDEGLDIRTDPNGDVYFIEVTAGGEAYSLMDVRLGMPEAEAKAASLAFAEASGLEYSWYEEEFNYEIELPSGFTLGVAFIVENGVVTDMNAWYF